MVGHAGPQVDSLGMVGSDDASVPKTRGRRVTVGLTEDHYIAMRASGIDNVLQAADVVRCIVHPEYMVEVKPVVLDDHSPTSIAFSGLGYKAKFWALMSSLDLGQ